MPLCGLGFGHFNVGVGLRTAAGTLSGRNRARRSAPTFETHVSLSVINNPPAKREFRWVQHRMFQDSSGLTLARR